VRYQKKIKCLTIIFNELMKVLMSGASGFIGSYFFDEFFQENILVDIIARKFPSNIPGTNAEIYKFDITKPINDVIDKDYDFFIHLAAANDVDSRESSEAILKTTFGTRNCLEFCVKNNIKKFIYFSTLQVYGESNIISEDSKISCVNDYAMTHYFAEEYVQMFRARGVDFIILRPSNVYGEFRSHTVNRWSLVPGCFCKSALEKNQIQLLSSGKQKRDFIYLEDLFRLTLHLINNFDLCKNQVYNASSNDVHSIISIAKLVKKMYETKFNKSCELIVKSNVPSIENDYRISNDLVKSIGYSSSCSSISSMESTIDFLLSRA